MICTKSRIYAYRHDGVSCHGLESDDGVPAYLTQIIIVLKLDGSLLVPCPPRTMSESSDQEGRIQALSREAGCLQVDSVVRRSYMIVRHGCPRSSRFHP
jgi:hypothetical protein